MDTIRVSLRTGAGLFIVQWNRLTRSLSRHSSNSSSTQQKPQKADVHASTPEYPVWSKDQTRSFLLWSKCAVFTNSDVSYQSFSADVNKNCGFQIQHLAQLKSTAWKGCLSSQTRLCQAVLLQRNLLLVLCASDCISSICQEPNKLNLYPNSTSVQAVSSNSFYTYSACKMKNILVVTKDAPLLISVGPCLMSVTSDWICIFRIRRSLHVWCVRSPPLSVLSPALSFLLLNFID